jgi:hypothetical protein
MWDASKHKRVYTCMHTYIYSHTAGKPQPRPTDSAAPFTGDASEHIPNVLEQGCWVSEVDDGDSEIPTEVEFYDNVMLPRSPVLR